MYETLKVVCIQIASKMSLMALNLHFEETKQCEHYLCKVISSSSSRPSSKKWIWPMKFSKTSV